MARHFQYGRGSARRLNVHLCATGVYLSHQDTDNPLPVRAAILRQRFDELMDMCLQLTPKLRRTRERLGSCTRGRDMLLYSR